VVRSAALSRSLNPFTAGSILAIAAFACALLYPRQQSRRRASPVGSSRSDEDAGGSYNFANDKQFQVNGNKVSATPTQEDIEMAERLGIKIEDQMKEKFKYAKQGYKGYVDITVG
jgi:hypothetical protein